LKKILSLLLLFCSQLPTAYCQLPPYWQQQVNCKIDVTLNDADHTLDGYIKMDYFNNSPDTLYFIWIHLWPNAYKNDRTAFSDQMLENGSTDFYFSGDDRRGYINRLDFKVNTITAKTEDHPQHQDIIKLILPTPLAPKSSCKIETPFHVKLPYNFSRGGHVDQSYQITQWYPKPAVYDRKGWHAMPYLQLGEFYSEFGDYEVQISLPKNYAIATTGADENKTEELLDLLIAKKKNVKDKTPPFPSDVRTKTILFKQKNIHDFAWFASKELAIKYDTLQLPSGKIIDVYAYYYPKNADLWKKSIAFIKQSILTKSKWLGEYPYGIVSVVDNAASASGGMEYPTIALVNSQSSEAGLQRVINHEIGHNWFYAILANNERDYPWMDEGMNTFYDRRYAAMYYNAKDANKFVPQQKWIKNKFPDYPQKTILQSVIAVKKDQPINTVSEKFSSLNYSLVSYEKAGQWMQLLETELGKDMFDSCMREYYRRFSFKHPYPEDFKKTMEEVSGKKLDAAFSLLDKKGDLIQTKTKKDVRFAPFFTLKETDKHHYIFASPAIGYNYYDKLMVGAVLHNNTLPASKFQFVLAPLFGTNSKQLNGIGRVGYSFYPDNIFQKVEVGIGGSKFSTNRSLDTFKTKVFANFYKAVPFIKLYFKQNSRSSTLKWLDIRSFIIGEKQFANFEYIAGSDSAFRYPTTFKTNTRTINQVSFNVTNSRVLYPYGYQLQLQQGKSFYRFNVTGNYFFNYSKYGGLQARVFFAKFGYAGAKNNNAYLYQPKLLAGSGAEDYTYSNYFLGRTASTSFGEIPVSNGGVAAQQIMISNTGGLKLRLDPYGSVQGFSEKWVAAFNVSSTLPDKLFPVKLPLKVFLDAGTYAEAWGKNASTPRFLYVGGLQLSLFKNVLNIYAPIIYSKTFKEPLKTDKEANRFVKKITFSIDIQNISLRKFIPQLNF
jgi:Peptidase family M1 domain